MKKILTIVAASLLMPITATYSVEVESNSVRERAYKESVYQKNLQLLLAGSCGLHKQP